MVCLSPGCPDSSQNFISLRRFRPWQGRQKSAKMLRMLRKMPREHAIYLLWLFSCWKWHSSWTLSTKETAKALDATLQEDEGRTWMLDFPKTMRYTVAWMLNKDKQDHHHPCSNPQPLGSTRDLISSHITDAPPPKTAPNRAASNMPAIFMRPDTATSGKAHSWQCFFGAQLHEDVLRAERKCIILVEAYIYIIYIYELLRVAFSGTCLTCRVHSLDSWKTTNNQV